MVFTEEHGGFNMRAFCQREYLFVEFEEKGLGVLESFERHYASIVIQTTEIIVTITPVS